MNEDIKEITETSLPTFTQKTESMINLFKTEEN